MKKQRINNIALIVFTILSIVVIALPFIVVPGAWSEFTTFDVRIVIRFLIAVGLGIFMLSLMEFIILMLSEIIQNIDDSYKHIPYTLKHRKKLIELSETYLGHKAYYFHDLDKVLMYILIPYIGPKIIHKIHAILSPHHVKYFRGISKVDKKQAILDWESARFTKPDKPETAAETLVHKYPQYIDDFSGYFYILGLGDELEKLVYGK